MTFEIDVAGLERACRSMEWQSAVLLWAGVAGFLFGTFWVAFSILCFIIDVGTLTNLFLLMMGGLAPAVGALVLFGFGVVRRVSASRLRELSALAGGSGLVSVERMAMLTNGDQSVAEAVLRRACELGVAIPVAVPLPCGQNTAT